MAAGVDHRPGPLLRIVALEDTGTHEDAVAALSGGSGENSVLLFLLLFIAPVVPGFPMLTLGK